MNKQQQELYEKLLKKVNEYCLGQAAEDVIAAIDNLLDTYETALDIIKNHKLLNYVLKNPKCAAVYGPNEQDKELLKEILK